MARDADALGERQARFVAEYLVDGNAAASYRRAGYRPGNDNSAAASSSALLRLPKVKAAIAKARTARSERTMVTADWVIERLQAEAQLSGEGASHAARVSALKILALHTGMLDGKGQQDARPQITTIVIERSARRQETEADGTGEGGPVEHRPGDGPIAPAHAPRPDEGVG
jgi:phage terminase small subunit